MLAAGCFRRDVARKGAMVGNLLGRVHRALGNVSIECTCRGRDVQPLYFVTEKLIALVAC